MAEDEARAPSAEDDTVTTKTAKDEAQPQQDGGVGADAAAGAFDDYQWESDDQWQLLLRGLDFGTLNEDRKKSYIEKRKHKYFKQKIDPSHEIPKVANKSRGSRYQAPPQSATSNNTDNNETNESNSNNNDNNDNSNENTNNNNDTKTSDNNDNTKSSSTKEEEKPKAQAKAKAKAQRTNSSNQSSAHRNAPQLSKAAEMLNYFFVISQWFIFINCVLSVIMPSSHYRALYGVIVSHIVALFQNTGRPQFNMYYAQRLFQDENVMIAIYGLMFLMGPPVFVFLIPVALRSLHMGCYMLSAMAAQKAPGIHSKIHPMLKKVTSQYYWFLKNVALAEVAVGIFLIPACFFISRTVILCLFYWQIMHARYMMSQAIKNAFTLVNQKLESIFARVPAVLNIYKKIAQFLYDKVDPVQLQEQMRQQQAGGGMAGGLGSMMKKCTIM